MQTVSGDFSAALEGSFTGVCRVDAWYDGELIFPDLPVTASTVTLDSTRLITGSLSLSVAGDDAELVPSRWNSPLACYGSEVQVSAGLLLPGGAAEMVSVGWFRIDSYDAAETWQTYSTGRVRRSATVQVQCSDRMSTLDDARFMSPVQPASLTSTIDEIRRLCLGLVPLADLSGVTDKAIPRSTTYQDSRSAAVQLLAANLGKVARVDPTGALNLYDLSPSGDAVFTVSVDADDVPLLGWTRKGDRSGLYNAVTSTGTAKDGSPLTATATEGTGPLRFSGPFGQVPYGHSNPLLIDAATTATDATTTLRNLIAQRTVLIPATAPANPALEVGDMVDIVTPDKTLTGPVSSIQYSLPPATMQLTVAVPQTSLWGLQ